MSDDYSSLRNIYKEGQPPVISVAVGQDRELIRTIKEAYREGLAEAILVGDKVLIEELLEEEGFSSSIPILHESNQEVACMKAVELVEKEEAHMLMKGLVNSGIFLNAILKGEGQKESKGFLSHLAGFQIPGYNRILYFSDGGMNINPGLYEKEKIITNGIKALHRLGISIPKVAVLVANEKLDPKVKASSDAVALFNMWEWGKFPGCILEGPITMDVAMSKEAAVHKGINSRIAGEADLFIVPDIQAGNMVGKALIYGGGAKMAGVILGAGYPVIMTSRAENTEGKLNSIALARALNITPKE